MPESADSIPGPLLIGARRGGQHGRGSPEEVHEVVPGLVPPAPPGGHEDARLGRIPCNRTNRTPWLGRRAISPETRATPSPAATRASSMRVFCARCRTAGVNPAAAQPLSMALIMPCPMLPS